VLSQREDRRQIQAEKEYGVSVQPDFKERPRIVDKNAGKEKVRREGRCRVTGVRYQIERFHVLPRDLGGDDLDVNIVPINHSIHHLWEQAPGGKQLFGPMIWGALEEDERAYVLEKKGVDFARRYYGVEL
jgi:hypothetical protein